MNAGYMASYRKIAWTELRLNLCIQNRRRQLIIVLDNKPPFHGFPGIWNHELWLKCLEICEKGRFVQNGGELPTLDSAQFPNQDKQNDGE